MPICRAVKQCCVGLLLQAIICCPLSAQDEIDNLTGGSTPLQSMEEEIRKLRSVQKDIEEKEKELTQAVEKASSQVEQQNRMLQEQEKRLVEQRRAFEQRKRQIEEVEIQIEELISTPYDPAREEQQQPEVKPAAKEAGVEEPPREDQTETAQPEKVGQPPPKIESQTLQVSDIISQRSILTRRGSLIVEPILQFAHSSALVTVIEGVSILNAGVFGLIEVREVQRNTVQAAVGFRMGVAERVELDAKIPYLWRHDRTTSRDVSVATATDDVLTTADGSDLGDVEIGLRYQLNYGDNGRPYYVLGLRVKSRTGKDPFEVETDPATGLQLELPTGSGFWAVQPSLSFSYPSDPAVFFGGVSYLTNKSRNIAGFGNIDPGNSIGIGLGMGFAINDNASFSIAFNHNVVNETKQNGVDIPGSDLAQVGTLIFGFSHRSGKRTNINVSLGIGVTDDAPDVHMSLRMPMSFSNVF
jgi:hypothetical protein